MTQVDYLMKKWHSMGASCKCEFIMRIVKETGDNGKQIFEWARCLYGGVPQHMMPKCNEETDE